MGLIRLVFMFFFSWVSFSFFDFIVTICLFTKAYLYNLMFSYV